MIDRQCGSPHQTPASNDGTVDFAAWVATFDDRPSAMNRQKRQFAEQVSAFDLAGFEVIALNVTKLRSDNVNPNEYLGRLSEWRALVETSGGEFRVINDLDGLQGML